MSTRDHAAWIHQGTTAERSALGLSTEGLSTEWWDTDLSQFHKWNGSAWVVFGPGADHGLMGGLGDDDHGQYVFNAPTASVRNEITPTAGTVVPLTITLDAAQSANAFLVQDSVGADLNRILFDGRMLVSPTIITSVAATNSVVVNQFVQPVANTAAAYTAITGIIDTTGANTSTIGAIRGLDYAASGRGSGVISEVTACFLRTQVIAGTTATFAYGLFIQPNVQIGATVARWYGAFINAFTGSTSVFTHGISIANQGHANVTSTSYGLLILAQSGSPTNYAIATASGICWFNYTGDATSDFTVSGDTDLRCFHVDASADAVGFGTAAPIGKVEIKQPVETGAVLPSFVITSAAHTALTASTERHEIHWDLSATQQFATGALGTQRAIRIEPPTYSAVGASVFANVSTVYIDGPPIAGANMTLTNTSALIIASGATVLGEATKQTNAGSLQLSGYLTFKEDAGAPTADAGYVKVWSESDNHLYYQSGDGDNHLLHGPAFSSIWYHGSASTLAIAAAETLTKITTFVNVGEEDDEGHAVGDVGNDEILLANGGGGVYEVGYGASLTATGAAKELICVAGVELATPLDITDVTDDLVSPIVITSVAHGLFNGDMVQILGVLGNTAANGSFMVANKANDTFEIVELGGGATTGNGDYNEGAPTGDVTIWYPGCITTHVVVSQTTLQVISSPGTPSLSLMNGDKIGLYIANLNDANDVNFSVVTLSVNRLDAH